MSGAWLIPPVALAAGLLALAGTPWSARRPVAVCLAVAAILLAVTAAVATRHKAHALRASEQLDAARAAEEDLLRLLEQAVPRVQRGELVEVVMGGLAVQDARGGVLSGAHASVVRTVLEAVAGEGALQDSAYQAVVALARRSQASVNETLALVREQQNRYAEVPDVFDALLGIDHGVAQAGRAADGIAVMGGAPPGRTWRQPVPLGSVVRGAMSRIGPYQRVKLDVVPAVWVDGSVVEALIHSLAELLDNATKYSKSPTQVRVSAGWVHSGVAVEIEDRGVGLTRERALWAAQVLSGEKDLTLADLGETPRFGLAVVGRLTRSVGVSVELRPSAYGGARAVVLIPESVLKTVAEQPPPAARPTPPTPPAPSAPLAPEVLPVEVEALVAGHTTSGLPLRRVDSGPGPDAPAQAPASGSQRPVDPAQRAAFVGQLWQAHQDAAAPGPTPPSGSRSSEVTQ